MKKSFPEIYIGSRSFFNLPLLFPADENKITKRKWNEPHRASFFVQLRVRDTRVFLRGCNRFRNCLRKLREIVLRLQEVGSFDYRPADFDLSIESRHRCKFEYFFLFFFFHKRKRFSFLWKKSLAIKNEY